jgi:hypothetical protein
MPLPQAGQLGVVVSHLVPQLAGGISRQDHGLVADAGRAPDSLRLDRHSKGAAFAPRTTESCQQLQTNTTPTPAVASGNGSRVAMHAALITAIREES